MNSRGRQQHRRPPRRSAGQLPEWVKHETNYCLVSIAEEAYTARGMAIDDYGADRYTSCSQLVVAGDKILKIMNDAKRAPKERCEAGERALRKFWEAKVCARRMGE